MSERGEGAAPFHSGDGDHGQKDWRMLEARKRRNLLSLIEEKMPSREERFAFWMSLTQPLVGRQRRSACMTVLLGPAGSGKTVLVQGWLESLKKQETTHQRVWYCITHPGEKPKPFCLRLLQELEREPTGNSVDDLWRELGATLHAAYELLMIDQAEHVSLLTAQYLRSCLFDTWGVSLFFVGRPELERTLRSDPYIESRIDAWHTIGQFDGASMDR